MTHSNEIITQAEQLFCQNRALFIANNNNAQPRTVLAFNDIFQLANGTFVETAGLSKQIAYQLLNQHLSYRKIYKTLLTQHCFSTSEVQSAASSDSSIGDRTNDQFSLKFVRDQINPQQVYIILKINHPAPHHFNKEITLHIEGKNGEVSSIEFPLLVTGKSQVIIDDNTLEFKQLCDNDSCLYLS